MIGARWTAGNRLELTRPNGRGDRHPHWHGLVWDFVVGAVSPADSREHAGPMGGKRTKRRWDVPVAESAVAPPGPIPNPVVTRCRAGLY